MQVIRFTLNIPEEVKVVNMCTGLVHHASEFNSYITIQVNNGHTIDLKSILGVMSLCYASGKEVAITINGEDEDLAYECIKKYCDRLTR